MKHTTMISIFFTFFFFMSLITLSGCTNEEEKDTPTLVIKQPEPIRGGFYRAPLWNHPATLDPAFVQDNYGEAIIHQVFDGLVRFDQHLSVLPALAETWQIKEEGKKYRFTLKKNARFHNMDSVTSRDVLFSIKRLLRAEPASAVLPHLLKINGAKEYRQRIAEDIPGLEIEGKKIFAVHLKEPHAPFLTALGMYQAAIVPEKEVVRLGSDFGKHPVGTGPFQFVSWEGEKTIHLRRFNEYYTGPAFLEGIQYKIYSRGQDPTALADFLDGHLEEMAVYGDIKEKLAGTNGLQWFHRPSLSLFFYGMNLKHPNLANPDLRKALSTAVDRQTFVERIYKGRFDIAKTILPPGMPGYTPLNQIEGYNPELALRHLIRSSGISAKGQPELEIVSAFKTPRVEQEMAMMKKYWAKLNINVKVKYITDWERFEAYLRSDAVQIYRYSWFADMPDPDSFLYSLFASNSPTNFMKLQDGNIDQMLVAARGVVDPVERAKIYQKIEAAIMEFTPLIPLFYMNVDRVYQPYIRSVEVSALGAHTMPLNRIWMDKSP